ncbi:hypothetical protein NT05LM_2996 [Listeria marthii FSL S4-120]|uniref:Uncharacterized protein n=1 Tax=Listeria marthii FSL S4-120 TaxID=702457 RepID=A0ABP2JWT7_9LIST|nr:hypothetical protein NT05LM_2996 [Listeria marthii FSL S4-120]
MASSLISIVSIFGFSISIIQIYPPSKRLEYQSLCQTLCLDS